MFDFRSFFNNFPYTDFHELNLDFILRKIGAIDGAVEEATEAATTATEAAGTAQTASFTAVEASQAAVNAKNSAVSAKFDAESARDAAQTAATNAAGSATTASQRAAAALAAQTAAEAARDAAQTARTGAQTSATNAANSATAAANSATSAANSATAAANSATAAASAWTFTDMGDNPNFNTAVSSGIYFFGATGSAVNPPGNLTYSYMYVIGALSGGRVCQIAYGGRSDTQNAVYIRYRGSSESDSWKPWKPILYDTSDEYAYNATIPPEGTTTTDICSYRANLYGPVKTLRLSFYVPKNTLSGTNMTVGTLPAAFRPMNEYKTCVAITAGAHANLSISTAGVITLTPLQDVALRTGGQTVTVTYF